MLNRISSVNFTTRNYAFLKPAASKTQNNASCAIQFTGNKISADKLLSTYKGYNNIHLAKSVSFTGAGSLSGAFDLLNKSMTTCKDEEHGRKGEAVGKRLDLSKLMSEFKNTLPNYDDAIKSNIQISSSKNSKTGIEEVTDARCQIKKGSDGQ